MLELYPEEKIPESVEPISPYPLWVESMKVFLIFAGGAVAMFFLSYLVTKDYRNIWFSLPFFVYPGLVRSQRQRVRSIPVYLALHLPLAIWLFLAPSLSATMGGIAFLAAWMIYSGVSMWKREMDQAASMLILYINMALLAVVLYATTTEECPEFRGPLAAFAVGYGILFLYYSHWVSVHDMLRSVEQHGNYSQKKCIRWNDKLFWSYLALAAVGSGIFLLLFWKEVSWLINGALNILGWILKWLAMLFGIRKKERKLSLKFKFEPERLIEKNTSDFWLMLEMILKMIVAIGLIALIVYMGYKLITHFKTTRKYQEADYEEVKVYYNSSKKNKKKSSIWQKVSRYLDQSYENRIRKEYYKKVRSHMGTRVQPYETPSEVGGKLQDVCELAQIYNEVRYGNERINDDEN